MGIRAYTRGYMVLQIMWYPLVMQFFVWNSTAMERVKENILDLRSAQYKKLDALSFRLDTSKAISLGTFSLDGIGTTGAGTTWQRITATSGFASESESTTFASKGIVQTADGRNLGFNVEVSMSRAFMQKIDTFEVQDYIKTDPLMINLDANIGSVSDQKFFFDLDSDGKEEQISFAGKGSGFLALDKNGDGKINDGSELFGTSSGDGFKDLAEYDEDKNGWIDENDSIFSKLKVWTKDEESCGSRDLKGDTNDTSFKLKQRGTEENYNGK